MANIFLFTGENHTALLEKLKYWKKSFIEKHSGNNLDQFDSITDKDIPSIVNALETEPFLADKRMMVLKGLPAGSEAEGKLDTESLEKALEHITDDTVIIFVSEAPDKRTRLYKLLSKIATIESFGLQKGSQPEKSTVFKMLDMIGHASPNAVVKSLEELARSGEEMMMMIFFMIVRQFRLLIQIRSLVDKGVGSMELAKRVKLAPFQVSALSRQAKSFTLAQLKDIYRKLTEIDLQIKTGKIPVTGGNEELLQLRIDTLIFGL